MNATTHIDRVGAWASFACAIHCLLLPVLFALIPVLGLGWLDNPWIDRGFLVAAILLVLLAHPKGFRQHCRWTPTLLAISGILGILVALIVCGDRPSHHYFFALGGILVAVSHILNQRLCRSCHTC